MEDWFVKEWFAEREANRVFREDVVARLTALETTNDVEDDMAAKESDMAAKSAQARVNWVGIAISGIALLVSIIAMV
jgi:hypothetical protein